MNSYLFSTKLKGANLLLLQFKENLFTTVRLKWGLKQTNSCNLAFGFICYDNHLISGNRTAWSKKWLKENSLSDWVLDGFHFQKTFGNL